MNLTSELSIFAYKEPKESGAKGEGGRKGVGERRERGGGSKEKRARRGRGRAV